MMNDQDGAKIENGRPRVRKAGAFQSPGRRKGGGEVGGRSRIDVKKRVKLRGVWPA